MLGQATSLPPAEAKILEKSTGFGRKTNDGRSERGLTGYRYCKIRTKTIAASRVEFVTREAARWHERPVFARL
jgi:hypothetical protein